MIVSIVNSTRFSDGYEVRLLTTGSTDAPEGNFSICCTPGFSSWARGKLLNLLYYKFLQLGKIVQSVAARRRSIRSMFIADSPTFLARSFTFSFLVEVK